MTPAGWELIDEAGPFRFRVVVQPSTTAYRAHFRKELGRHSTEVAAHQLGNAEALKVLAKANKRRVKKTAAETRAQTQKTHDVTRSELLVSLVQVFGDGRQADLADSELDYLFRVPDADDREYPAVTDGADGYAAEDIVGGEEVWKSLEARGESLASALVRFIAFHSERAGRQRKANDEAETLGPLGYTSDSGPGSGRSTVQTLSAVPSSGSASADSAGPALQAGSSEPAAASARAMTG